MNIFERIRQYKRYRATVEELHRLSNRELSDIGITRSEIPCVARRVL